MFGPKVVGEDAFAEAVQAAKVGSNIFGSRVVGAAADANIFGSAVGDGPAEEEKAKQDNGLSVAKLGETLKANASFFDTLYEAELARAEGPRKSALAFLRTFELGHQNRENVIAELDALMAPKPHA